METPVKVSPSAPGDADPPDPVSPAARLREARLPDRPGEPAGGVSGAPARQAVQLPAGLEPDVVTVLRDTADALIGAFENHLVALILFGSAAEGRMRASSDVNLLVLLSQFEVPRADAARAALQLAASAIQLHPLLVREDELQWAAEAFSVKFDDIGHRHFLMWGTDPFASLQIPRALIIQRLRQTLLNTAFRLRTVYVAGSRYDEKLVQTVASAAAPLRRGAFAILELRGTTPASPKAALETLVKELPGAWEADLALLSEARENARLAPGAAAQLLIRLSELALALRATLEGLAP